MHIEHCFVDVSVKTYPSQTNHSTARAESVWTDSNLSTTHTRRQMIERCADDIAGFGFPSGSLTIGKREASKTLWSTPQAFEAPRDRPDDKTTNRGRGCFLNLWFSTPRCCVVFINRTVSEPAMPDSEIVVSIRT
jgi:hypothetical protein